MNLCLASGSSSQYRRDVLRSLALPMGAHLQFRYQANYVGPEARAVVESGRTDIDAIIAYVNQNTDDQGRAVSPQIIPCRFAIIRDARPYGRAVVLELEVREFCSMDPAAEKAADPQQLDAALDRFNQEVRWSTPSLPDWSGTGHYWADIPDSVVPSRSNRLSSFEDTVKYLHRAKDFAEEPLYFHLCGFKALGASTGARFSSGSVVLEANRSYDLEFFHFHPGVPSRVEIEIRSGSASIGLANPTIHCESRYDFKRVALRVVNPSMPASEFPVLDPTDERWKERAASVLSVSRTASSMSNSVPAGARVNSNPKSISASNERRLEWDFDIPVQIVPDLDSVKKLGILVGATLATPAIIAVLANPKWDWPTKAIAIAVAVGVSGFGGMLNSLAAKRN